MNNCIAIDWLQLHVQVPLRSYELYQTKYVVRRRTSGTKNFKSIFDIYLDDAHLKCDDAIAVLVSEPYNVLAMKEDSGLLKITNKYLYQKNLKSFVETFLNDLGLIFKNITRMDIAYDFLKFDTMECRDFLQRFSDQTYMKRIQCGFKVMGDSWSVLKGKIVGGVNSLKFGKETSDTSYYLYNKTLELQQVKHKPWIHDHWKSNKWDGETDVYRLEFSMRPTRKAIVNIEGTVSDMSDYITFKDLNMIEKIDSVFKAYFNDHFNFVVAEKSKRGNWKKQSRCSAVVLFECLKFCYVKIDLSQKGDSTRSTKIFAKQLKIMNDELRGVDRELGLIGDMMFTYVVKSRDLIGWAKRKLNAQEDDFNPKVYNAVSTYKIRQLMDSGSIDLHEFSKLSRLVQLSLNF